MGWFDRSQKAKSLLTCLGVTLAYWATVFVGPLIVVLLIALVDLFTPGSGSFIIQYLIPFFSQAIACYYAYVVAISIGKTDCKICVLVNCIVCACVCVLFILFSSTTKLDISNIGAAISCIYTAVLQAKDINQKV